MSLFDDFCRRVAAAPRELLPNALVLGTVDSSNALARRLAEGLREGDIRCPRLAIFALEQTSGRGRLGRSWVSTRGKGIYVTLVCRVPAATLERLPLLVPVALVGCLRERRGCRATIKWPNDLHAGGRKLGGILIESLAFEPGTCLAVIGFGINHGHGEDELPTPVATSLRLCSERAGALPDVAVELATAVAADLRSSPELAGLVEDYTELSSHCRGDRLRCRTAQGEANGVFVGFDGRGHLRLEVDGRERTIASGEIVE
ncbi:MAG: biotin--[acetyl-CoA-carboxylase] ligase [Thermoanaerobaculia bacterium]|nr:biotin--[acetyl-CoA-carboxylase] ligase [Thermoanaerobaculia bacterium]